MTAFEGNDIRKHRMENVARCSKLMDRHIVRFPHRIVELLCATGNNGHSAQVYIYVLIIYIGVVYVKFSDNAWQLIIKMSH